MSVPGQRRRTKGFASKGQLAGGGVDHTPATAGELVRRCGPAALGAFVVPALAQLRSPDPTGREPLITAPPDGVVVPAMLQAPRPSPGIHRASDLPAGCRRPFPERGQPPQPFASCHIGSNGEQGERPPRAVARPSITKPPEPPAPTSGSFQPRSQWPEDRPPVGDRESRTLLGRPSLASSVPPKGGSFSDR